MALDKDMCTVLLYIVSAKQQQENPIMSDHEIGTCRDCQTPTVYGIPDYLDTNGNTVCPDCAQKDPNIYTGYLDAKRAASEET